MADGIDIEESAAGEVPASGLGFGMRAGDALPIVAAAAGLAASLSGQQPTGNSAADFALSFAFGWIVVWFAQHAKSEAVLMGAVLTLFFSGLQMPAVALALAATACAVLVTAVVKLDRESHVIGLVVSAALVSQAALHLSDVGFTGSASLLAIVAIAPIIVTGFRQTDSKTKQFVTRAALGCVLFAVIASVLAAVAALGIRSQVELGIEQAEDGVDALQQADRDAALTLLGQAEQNFQQASDRLGGPLTWPARIVPITAQHSRALETAAHQGLALARTAARTGNQADVERIRGANGAIDLSIVEAVNTELTLANGTVQGAQQSLLDVSSPWLVPQLSSRLDSVQVELVEAGATIDLANHATAVLPPMLGSNGLRRYLVLFVQPSESREFGGFVGAYGILEADQGRLTLLESGSVDTDLGSGAAQFSDVSLFPETYARIGPQINPQNLTATADLSTIAAAAADFVPQWRVDPEFTIDGVMTIDPYALAGLLELTGPLAVEGRVEPLDANNVVDYLLREQYLEFDGDAREQRQDILRVLAGQAFQRLLSIETPGPERLGQIFGPLARANRLSFTTFNAVENAFLDRVFLSANMPNVGSAVDMIGVYGQTGTASKLDGYAYRSSTYEVTINPATGELTGELTIVERNEAPADASDYVLGRTDLTGPAGGELGLGSNYIAYGVYTRGEVTSIEVDTPFRVEDADVAFSYMRHPVFVEVPLGGMSTTRLVHTWQVEPGRYDVAIPAQATANASEFTLIVRPTNGWRIAPIGIDPAALDADGSWRESSTLVEARLRTFFFEES